MKNIIWDFSRKFSVPYYLTIEGESDKQGHQFTGTYMHPFQLSNRNGTILSIWCKEKGINYVTADTIDELIIKLSNFEPTIIWN